MSAHFLRCKCRKEADICTNIKDSVALLQGDSVPQVAMLFEDLSVQESYVWLANVRDTLPIGQRTCFQS